MDHRDGHDRRVSSPPSIATVLDRPLRDQPDHEALVTRSRRLTYADLDAEADRAARALWALGIRPGDRVAASLPNDAEVVVAFHGAMRLGAVWLGINRALAPPEKRFQLEDSGASLLLCDDDVGDLGDRASSTGRSGATRCRPPRPARSASWSTRMHRPASPTPAAPPADRRVRSTASGGC